MRSAVRNTARRDKFRKIIAADQPPCAINGCTIDYNAHHLAPNSFTIDHIIPRNRGGLDVLENIQPACRACNRAKSDHLDTGVAFVTERVW